MRAENLIQRRVPLLAAADHRTEHFAAIPFNVVEAMPYGIGARIIDHTLEQDQKILIRLRCRSHGTAGMEQGVGWGVMTHNLRGIAQATAV